VSERTPAAATYAHGGATAKYKTAAIGRCSVFG